MKKQCVGQVKNSLDDLNELMLEFEQSFAERCNGDLSPLRMSALQIYKEKFPRFVVGNKKYLSGQVVESPSYRVSK